MLNFLEILLILNIKMVKCIIGKDKSAASSLQFDCICRVLFMVAFCEPWYVVSNLVISKYDTFCVTCNINLPQAIPALGMSGFSLQGRTQLFSQSFNLRSILNKFWPINKPNSIRTPEIVFPPLAKTHALIHRMKKCWVVIPYFKSHLTSACFMTGRLLFKWMTLSPLFQISKITNMLKYPTVSKLFTLNKWTPWFMWIWK